MSGEHTNVEKKPFWTPWFDPYIYGHKIIRNVKFPKSIDIDLIFSEDARGMLKGSEFLMRCVSMTKGCHA